MAPGLAMVCFASEQLWPNLSGLLHWDRHGDGQPGAIHTVYVYYTADHERSELPAQRLLALCRRQLPGARAILPDHPGEETPQGVAQVLDHWRREAHAAGLDVVVNASGGHKLMYAGALSCVGMKACQVVYRELSGQWYELRRDCASQLEAIAIAVSPAETDRIPVADLVTMQFGQPAHAAWRWQKAEDLPVETITRHGAANNWDWVEAFAQIDRRPQAPGEGSPPQSPGLLFERYVAAVLRAMGVTNCVTNLTLQTESGALQEIDIVANHGGRLLIVDCKLMPGAGNARQPVIDQVARAAQLRRSLGGLAASCVMLRPSDQYTQAQRDYAKDMGLRVVDRDACHRLCTILAQEARCRLPLPDRLVDVETQLAANRAAGRTAFARQGWQHGGTMQAQQEMGLDDIPEFSRLEMLARRRMAAESHHWCGFEWQGRYYLLAELQEERQWTESQVTRALKQLGAKAELGFGHEVWLSNSLRWAYLCLTVDLQQKGWRPRLAQMLRARSGQFLLP